jgi:hypothetical protein
MVTARNLRELSLAMAFPVSTAKSAARMFASSMKVTQEL